MQESKFASAKRHTGYNIQCSHIFMLCSSCRHDTTKTGHDLGDPANRHTPNGVDRYLSAPAVCIVRAIMHSAFIWAACNNEAMIETLAQLVSPPVAPSDLPEFYWRHLERDVQDLSEITSRGIDECAMIIHLVLGDILSKSPPACKHIIACISLNCTPIQSEAVL